MRPVQLVKSSCSWSFEENRAACSDPSKHQVAPTHFTTYSFSNFMDSIPYIILVTHIYTYLSPWDTVVFDALLIQQYVRIVSDPKERAHVVPLSRKIHVPVPSEYLALISPMYEGLLREMTWKFQWQCLHPRMHRWLMSHVRKSHPLTLSIHFIDNPQLGSDTDEPCTLHFTFEIKNSKEELKRVLEELVESSLRSRPQLNRYHIEEGLCRYRCFREEVLDKKQVHANRNRLDFFVHIKRKARVCSIEDGKKQRPCTDAQFRHSSPQSMSNFAFNLWLDVFVLLFGIFLSLNWKSIFRFH